MELLSGSGRKCWSAGAGNQDQLPANCGFRAPAGCQRRRRRIKAGYGHPEATLTQGMQNAECRMENEECQELPSGYPEAILRLPSGHLVANR